MKNTIHLGDCLQILPSIRDKSVDLVICDLPYGELKGLCKWDIPIDMKEFWRQMKRVLRTPNSPVVFWGSLKFFANVLYPSNAKWYRYEVPVFKKTCANPYLSKVQPKNNMEFMFVFSQKKANYFYEKFHIALDGTTSSGGLWGKYKMRTKSYKPLLPAKNTIIKQIMNNKRSKNTHPTKKCPKCQYDLAKYLVNEGGTILDPCMGIGTTGETAKMLNCNFIGIEMQTKYFYQNPVFF